MSKYWLIGGFKATAIALTLLVRDDHCAVGGYIFIYFIITVFIIIFLVIFTQIYQKIQER